MTSRLRTLIFFCMAMQPVILTIGNAQLTGPVATSVLVDTEAQLNCIWPGASQSSDWLEWGFTNASGYHRIYISINSNVFPSMSQDYGIERINETGEFNLIVKNVTYELASRRLHACSLVQAPVTQSAIIVAVEKVQCPGAIEEIEGTEVQIECIVRYASYQDEIRPMLNWTASENTMPQHYQRNETHAWSYMNLTLDSTYDEMNFTCALSYDGEYPDYNDSCTTLLYVLYGVNNVSFDPEINDGDELVTGTVITCMANGRPAATVHWEGEDNSTVGSGAELTVTEDMLGKELLFYTCYAMNYVGGVNYTQSKTLSFIAIPASPGEVATNSVETWVIVVSVVVPVTVIAIVAVIVVLIIFRRRRQHRKENRQGRGNTAATVPMSVTATTTQQPTGSPENQPFLYSASNGPPAPVPVATPRPLSDGSNGVPVGMGYADLGVGTRSPNQPNVNGVDGRGLGSQYGGSLSRVNTPNPMTYPYQPSGRLTPGSAVVPGGRGTPGTMMTGPPSVAAYGVAPGGGASRAGSTGRMTPGPGPGVDMRTNPSTGYPYQQRPPSVGSASTLSQSGSSYHGSQHGGMPPALSLPPQRSMDAGSHAGSLV